MRAWLKRYLTVPPKTKRGVALKILSLPVVSALAFVAVIGVSLLIVLSLPLHALVALLDKG